MKRMYLVFIGVVLMVMTSCRLPLDVHLDRYPDLKFVVYRMDGSAFGGVEVTVADPLNSSTTNGGGEATLLVYRDGSYAYVSFKYLQRTPDVTRWMVAGPYAYGLPNRGLNIYAISLPDRALYAPPAPNGDGTDAAAAAKIVADACEPIAFVRIELNEYGDTLKIVPQKIEEENGVIYIVDSL